MIAVHASFIVGASTVYKVPIHDLSLGQLTPSESPCSPGPRKRRCIRCKANGAFIYCSSATGRVRDLLALKPAQATKLALMLLVSHPQNQDEAEIRRITHQTYHQDLGAAMLLPFEPTRCQKVCIESIKDCVCKLTVGDSSHLWFHLLSSFPKPSLLLFRILLLHRRSMKPRYGTTSLTRHQS